MTTDKKEKEQPVKIKPWKTQFFECKKIREEPPMNAKGFWVKPDFTPKIEKR